MSVQITIELPESVFSALKKWPIDFVGEMRLAAAVKWYEMGMIYSSEATEIAGVSRQEFLQILYLFCFRNRVT
jgi:predicted HTH domain antitoxin